jgi:hypothetical protein
VTNVNRGWDDDLPYAGLNTAIEADYPFNHYVYLLIELIVSSDRFHSLSFEYYTAYTERPDGVTNLTVLGELLGSDDVDVDAICLLGTLEVRQYYVMREMQIDMCLGSFHGLYWEYLVMHAMLLRSRSAVSDTLGLLAQTRFFSVDYFNKYML